MNWFVIINGLSYTGATCWSLWSGNYLWASVWASYAVSCFALAVLEASK